MPRSGYTGISYPFRITSRGGVAMSTTSSTDATHINESIEQIFKTEYLERPMEGYEVYTTVTALLFEPNDLSLQQVLKSRIVSDLNRLEDRVVIDESGIEFSVEDINGINCLYAIINYKVRKYNTYYTAKVKVGEVK